MAEDAAAAARRIVEEVLARRGSSSGEIDAEPGAGVDPKGPDGAQEPPDARQELPGPAGSGQASEVAGAEPDVSEAARIARRIVEEVLVTAADTPVAGRGGARDDRPAEDEWTARIVAGGESATTRRVRGADGEATASLVGPETSAAQSEVAPGEPTGVPHAPADDAADAPADDAADAPADDAADAPADAPADVPGESTADSAESIVRRIVADVQAEAIPTGTGEDAGVGQDTAHLPTTATVSEPPVAVPPVTEASPPPTTPVADDLTDPPEDEAAVTRGVPRSGGHAGPSVHSGVPLAIADEGHGEDRTASGSRPLVGWAVPPEPEPPAAPEVDESPSRTLRWLLASLLGALALAVLFPLAVAALRALVSLG